MPAEEDATRAAVLLLNDAVTVQLDGRHHRLLRSLRYLEDPALRPLFEGLAQETRHASLRVHGLLGLAEISEPRTLDAQQIAAVNQPDVQAELIGAALDGDLIDHDTAKTLLGWRGLDPAVKLLLATPLIADGEFDAASPGYDGLAQALNHEALGQHGLAALLLHELGDSRGTQALEKLAQRGEPAVDAVRAMLLETAWTHGLARSAGWAFDVSRGEGLPTRLEMLALRVAIRFGDERADADWAARYAAAEGDASRRAWLALAGLEVAPWLAAERFEVLTASDDRLLARLGAAGYAVANRRQDRTDQAEVQREVEALLALGHPHVCRWAADYAQETGASAVAAAVVRGYVTGEERGRARRLDAVVRATQTWVTLDPGAAEDELVAALDSAERGKAWRQAVLLGLIRSRSDTAQRIAQRLGALEGRPTSGLVVVLRVQRPGALSQREREALEVAIRGGVGLDDSLRVQAAWAYLKRTGQASEAVAALLAP